MSAKLSLSDAQKWIISFPTSKPINGSPYRARLLCFHWAGGNAQTFRPWNKLLPCDDIHVTAVMLPGRLSRGAEKIPTNVHEIVGEHVLPNPSSDFSLLLPSCAQSLFINA
jgi:hypothetical protein